MLYQMGVFLGVHQVVSQLTKKTEIVSQDEGEGVIMKKKTCEIFVRIIFSLLLIRSQKLFGDLSSFTCHQLLVLQSRFERFVHKELTEKILRA